MGNTTHRAASVAQRIEHLASNQRVNGRSDQKPNRPDRPVDPYTGWCNHDRERREASALRSAAWYGARGCRALAAEATAAVMAAQPNGQGWHHWWMAFVSIVPKTTRRRPAGPVRDTADHGGKEARGA